ncbi:unnamed protein product [Prorocentrum cordatum]|uniref:Uncharacterized protein n=1 Tax=Prorocentrum cordatum TaxID=2364126 RepID=A0ABN9TKW3_9DINO|nr:unnamed protein product [Polarella glacialis]
MEEFADYYITDYASPPAFFELSEQEQQEVLAAHEDERVSWRLEVNCSALHAAGFKLDHGHGTPLPYRDVDVFDWHSIRAATGLAVEAIGLFVFNGPNHGTYGRKGQSANCPQYHNSTSHFMVNGSLINSLRSFSSRSSVLMVAAAKYEPSIRMRADGRGFVALPVAGGDYWGLCSSRTVLCPLRQQSFRAGEWPTAHWCPSTCSSSTSPTTAG